MAHSYRPRIVIIGHVCIDQNQSEHAQYTNWGSTALYMADFLQREHHLRPDIVTRYGRDFLPFAGEFNLHPLQPQEARTQLNGNMAHGVGRIFKTLYHAHAGPPRIDAEARALIAQADVLIIAPLLPNYSATFVREITRHAPTNCFTALTIQGYLRDVTQGDVLRTRDFIEADDVLQHFDAAVFSTEDHPNAQALASQWAGAHSRLQLVLTDGPNGAALYRGQKVRHIATKPVPAKDIIDSVGCGDVFAGSFFMTLANHPTRPVAAVRTAHAAARKKLFTSVSGATKKTSH